MAIIDYFLYQDVHIKAKKSVQVAKQTELIKNQIGSDTYVIRFQISWCALSVVFRLCRYLLNVSSIKKLSDTMRKRGVYPTPVAINILSSSTSRVIKAPGSINLLSAREIRENCFNACVHRLVVIKTVSPFF